MSGLKMSKIVRILCDNLIDDDRTRGRRFIPNRNSKTFNLFR